MKKILFSFALVIGFCSISNAQKIKLTSGDLSPLKSESAVTIQFKYDDMVVGKKTESEYIADKVAEYNNKEEGKGDKWLQAWKEDRGFLFEPKFVDLFNKQEKLKLTEKPQKYTLIFHTVYTEPGYNIGISRSNAYINGILYLVETENPDKILAEISIIKSPGRDVFGYDFTSGQRISEAYAIAGKKLGAFIKKNCK